jgi:hypothetical protein
MTQSSQVLGSNQAAKSGMGVEIGTDIRACVPGDDSPAGTVRDGYRKVISDTPFSKVCRWEKAK